MFVGLYCRHFRMQQGAPRRPLSGTRSRDGKDTDIEPSTTAGPPPYGDLTGSDRFWAASAAPRNGRGRTPLSGARPLVRKVKVLLVAMTGRAAKRLAELTDQPAYTISCGPDRQLDLVTSTQASCLGVR